MISSMWIDLKKKKTQKKKEQISKNSNENKFHIIT